MRFLVVTFLALWLGCCAEPLFAHSDGVTQGRLTIDENRQFRLQLLNFDALNYLVPELAKANLKVESLHQASDSALENLLNQGKARFLQELQVFGAQQQALEYQLTFPTLQQFKSQLWVKRATPEEPSFIVKVEGQAGAGNQQLYIQFPPRLNQVALKKVSIERLHIGAGSTTDNLLASETSQSLLDTVVKYVQLGFVHIVPKGLDHILFVLGLLFLSYRIKPLVWQISAFTLAHTVTLALTTYGVISLPSSIVEPLIALSIVFIAVENLVSDKMHPWRPLVVFGFGLLHGMGFAGVLSEVGLPDDSYLSALIAFNVGVELGQLAVVAIAMLLLFKSFQQPWYRRYIAMPASVAIGCVGLFWTLERLFW